MVGARTRGRRRAGECRERQPQDCNDTQPRCRSDVNAGHDRPPPHGAAPRAGGPSSNAVAHTVEKKKGLFGRKTEIEITFTDDASLPIYETLSVRGIDPVVQLGTLEELLTGRSFEDILDDPSAEDIATDGERLVLRLNDALPPALIAATNQRLAEVATPWAQTEEFGGGADPADLVEFLTGLRELAQRSASRGERLYCWVSP